MPGSPDRVYILILSANEGSGVTATMATLANGLVEHHDVEVISLFRFADQPAFRFDPRVKMTYLKEARKLPEGRKGRAVALGRRLRHPLSRGLESRPSTLIKDLSPTNAYTDRLLEKKLGAIDDGVVISNRPMLHEAAARWLRPEIPLLATEHATFPQRGPAIIDIYRRYATRFRAMVTLTVADQSDWRKELGDTGNIIVIPNAVPDRGTAVSRLENKVVVAAGALIGRKAFDRLIDAYAPLATRFPDWRLDIYGKGPDRTKLRRQIKDLGLEGKVVLKGFDPNYQASISEASVYAMSSHFEAFPMVLLESMSAGVPIVSFDCPTGPGHLITDEVDGILVPDGDIPAYTEALARLMGDEDLRKRMGEAALATIKDYSVEAIVAQWQQQFTAAT